MNEDWVQRLDAFTMFWFALGKINSEFTCVHLFRLVLIFRWRRRKRTGLVPYFKTCVSWKLLSITNDFWSSEVLKPDLFLICLNEQLRKCHFLHTFKCHKKHLGLWSDSRLTYCSRITKSPLNGSPPSLSEMSPVERSSQRWLQWCGSFFSSFEGWKIILECRRPIFHISIFPSSAVSMETAIPTTVFLLQVLHVRLALHIKVRISF